MSEQIESLLQAHAAMQRRALAAEKRCKGLERALAACARLADTRANESERSHNYLSAANLRMLADDIRALGSKGKKR